MKKVLLFAAAALMSTAMYADLQVADFENINLAPESEFSFNVDTVVYFESGSFKVQETVAYGGSYVSGAVVSSHTDTEFAGYQDANKSIAGGAFEGQNYVVWYADSWTPNSVKLDEAAVIPGMYVCNNVYAYSSMVNGDSFAGDPFGEEDWFLLTINGSREGVAVDAKVDFYLAKGKDILKEWAYVDLTPLGEIDELTFSMSGSRTGDYGLNTPSYFCFDNLGAKEKLQVATFEDVEIAEAESVLHLTETGTIKSGCFLFTQEVSVSDWGTYYYGNLPTNKSDNTFESYLDAEKSASGGAYEGKNFVVWTASYIGADGVALDHAAVVPGFFINNTAYDVNSMTQGDSFAKKFGKDDWFKLTITASLEGVDVNTQVVVDLAADGKYINEWTYVDLSVLGEVDAIKFALTSSDNGDFGMNTPAYFALDNFGAVIPEGYVAPEMAEFGLDEAIDNTNAAEKSVKVIRNGQVVIVRGNKTFNVLGAEL